MDIKAKEIGATEECPVFEVAHERDRLWHAFKKGQIVEGCDVGSGYLYVIGESPMFRRTWIRQVLYRRHLRPLTRAAREMLALVTP